MYDERHSGEPEKDIQETISAVVEFCLRCLVKMKDVSEDQLRHRVCVDWNSSERLRRCKLAAAVTQDNEGRAVLKLDRTLSLGVLVWAIPHEAVHIAQICRGDLRYLPDRITYWKGRLCRAMDADDPDYFHQPWEAEAELLGPKLRAAIVEKCPGLGKLLSPNT